MRPNRDRRVPNRQPVRLVLVRHARAGHKRAWTGPDDVRPLDRVGERHAIALAALLKDVPATLLLSSPTRRCLQTLAPLASALDRTIETTDALGPLAAPDGVVAMLDDPAYDGAIICTHGEVMRPVLDVLLTRGLRDLDGLANRRRLLTKGSAWDITTTEGGRVAGFRHLDPTR